MLARISVAVSVVVCIPFACQKVSSVDSERLELGEPVSVKVTRPDNEQVFEIVIAVTRGRDVTTYLEPLVKALVDGVNSCPEFVKQGAAGGSAEIAFVVDRGAAKVLKARGSGITRDCVMQGIEGRLVLGGAHERFVVSALVRVAATIGVTQERQ